MKHSIVEEHNLTIGVQNVETVQEIRQQHALSSMNASVWMRRMIVKTVKRKDMRIKCASIRYNDQIYEGNNHAEIGNKMIRDGICKPPFPGGDDQGFVTECGKYVRRAPARMIALRAGQIGEKSVHPKWLFSEDLNANKSSKKVS